MADHAAVLFFCIVELENIDPMYKFSLPWFISIYHQSIIEAEHKSKIEERISDLKTKFTDTMYTKISRSLFHEHVLIFSFILCVGIVAGEGKVVPEVRGLRLEPFSSLQTNCIFPPGLVRASNRRTTDG